MITIKLINGDEHKVKKIERRVEIANPTQMPIAFYISFEDDNKQVEIPYTAIASIEYE